MLNKQIKKVRKSKNLSITEFAKIIEGSTGFICEVENGKRMPGSRFLIALIEKFNISIDWVLTGEGEMFITKKEIIDESSLEIKYRKLFNIIHTLPEESVDIILPFMEEHAKQKAVI
jgi:transcriptional regulator with XRE-family HTH domain